MSISDGTATSSKRDPSILNYRVTSQLPKAISRFLPGAGTYQVIKTDYNNYMVLYSCTTLAIAHYPIVHVGKFLIGLVSFCNVKFFRFSVDIRQT